MSNKISNTNEFITKAKIKHSDKYNYLLVNYINAKTKIKIICLIHGEFEQTPNKHLNGRGCPKCSGNFMDTNYFIEKAKIKHADKYDYTLVNYLNNKTKIKIICPIHGEFQQSPDNHLNGQGCGKCCGKNKTTKELIKQLITKHGNKYDYSLVEYKNSETKIKIICPIHGIFKQNHNMHLKGQGCPFCKESKGENEIKKKLIENNVNFIRQKTFNECRHIRPLPFDFYLPDHNICIEYHGKQHYESIPFFGGIKTFEKQQKNDEIKKQYCVNNNIKLIVVPYNKNNNNMILEKIIKENV